MTTVDVEITNIEWENDPGYSIAHLHGSGRVFRMEFSDEDHHIWRDHGAAIAAKPS